MIELEQFMTYAQSGELGEEIYLGNTTPDHKIALIRDTKTIKAELIADVERVVSLVGGEAHLIEMDSFYKRGDINYAIGATPQILIKKLSMYETIMRLNVTFRNNKNLRFIVRAADRDICSIGVNGEGNNKPLSFSWGKTELIDYLEDVRLYVLSDSDFDVTIHNAILSVKEDK